MKRFWLVLSLLILSIGQLSAEENRGVVVTIAPLHSLVQGVMGETGNAELLIRGYASPHGFHLKPSQIQSLRKAAMVFYISEGFEIFLSRSLNTVPEHVEKISLFEDAAVKILKNRGGGAWASHRYDMHEAHGEDKSAERSDFENDFHLWLDPENAAQMVKKIAQELSETFPENKKTYQLNAEQVIANIRSADLLIEERLKPVRHKPYAVFHDAYQYFERHYKLTSVGSILLEPDENPSISRLREIRKRMASSKAVCIFQEPQFSEKLVRTVTEDTGVKTASLDPIGSNLTPGKDLYLKMLEQMAEDIARCLG